MPMIDAHIPEGALRPEAEAVLIDRLTGILMAAEGFDRDDPVMRKVSWVFVHRPAAVYVAGAPADEPRYRVVPSVPEGQFNAENRAQIVAEVTEAVLDAEEGSRPRDKGRVWVFPTEIPEGQWGSRGRIYGLAGILSHTHSEEEARALAAKRIARSRAERVAAGREEHVATS